MTPEEKSLLERTYKMVEENNQILLSMRRMSRMSTAFRITYWVVIILIGIGAFYFIQPYIDTMMGLVGDTKSGLSSLSQTMESLGYTSSFTK